MIDYYTGDLLDSGCHYILHSCNCLCNMGAGIAKQISHRFPEARLADLLTEKGDPAKLGTISVGRYNKFDTPVIINLYSQYGYGGRSKKTSTNLVALERALVVAREFISEDSKCPPHQCPWIGMPRLGCGLGRANWEDVAPIVERVFVDYVVHVYSKF